MSLLNLKALHIIFVITWFSGLFYIVRLFVYYAEARLKPPSEKLILQTQYKLMSRRLWYIITWPSAILASLFGTWMLFLEPAYLNLPWMQLKLVFVLLLFLYHGYCHHLFNKLQDDRLLTSSNSLRLINELPTLLLFAIVFLVVLKHSINWIYSVLGLFGLMLLLMFGIKLYKKLRQKKGWEKQNQQ